MGGPEVGRFPFRLPIIGAGGPTEREAGDVDDDEGEVVLRDRVAVYAQGRAGEGVVAAPAGQDGLSIVRLEDRRGRDVAAVILVLAVRRVVAQVADEIMEGGAHPLAHVAVGIVLVVPAQKRRHAAPTLRYQATGPVGAEAVTASVPPEGRSFSACHWPSTYRWHSVSA